MMANKVPADKEMVDLVKKILEQEDIILEMHKLLIDSICKPSWYMAVKDLRQV